MTTAALDVVSHGANSVWVMVVVVNPLYQERESCLVPIYLHPVQFMHKRRLKPLLLSSIANTEFIFSQSIPLLPPYILDKEDKTY